MTQTVFDHPDGFKNGWPALKQAGPISYTTFTLATATLKPTNSQSCCRLDQPAGKLKNRQLKFIMH